jgi:hypothetical protein
MQNVRLEPIDMDGGSFASFFRSARQGLFAGGSQEEELEETYLNMATQEEHDRRWHGATPVRDAFRSASGFFGGQVEEPPESKGFFESARQKGLIRTLTPGFLRRDEDEDFASTCCPNLGFKQRICGCALCFLAGQLLQFFAFGATAGVLVGHPGRFARCYSMGNFMMVVGSFFLSGPRRQCNKIKEKNRLFTFSVFVGSMALTLTAVFASPFFGRAILILSLVIVQWCAQVWYILSYIPYGHTFGRTVVRKFVACFYG